MVRMLSWNVRGLNDINKRAMLKNVLREWHCDLICLQETKLEDVNFNVVRSIWGNHHVGFSVLKARGAAGGVLVLWNANMFHLFDSLIGDFSITCFLHMRDGSVSWAFTGIYGPHVRTDKLRMLEELGSIRDRWSGPWCLGGVSMRYCMLTKEVLVFAPLMQ